MTTKMEELKKEIIDKSNYMVSITSTITKTETWLIENETEEDAKYIATDQNCSPRFKCTKWNTDESDPEFDDEVIAKEVSFELTDDGKRVQYTAPKPAFITTTPTGRKKSR